MHLIYKVIFLLFVFFPLKAEILKPNPSITPIDVVSIQLKALKDNNIPYENAGIEQTWEFAHPSNRIYTGPLERFTNMMYNPSYSMMLNHQDHKIIIVDENDKVAHYFIELIDDSGKKFGFKWTLKKVESSKDFLNCWMTTSVSSPMLLSQSS